VKVLAERRNVIAPLPLGKAALLVAAFGALGYLGNLLRLPLGFNLAFIFGSTFTLMATALLGWRHGLAATLLASAYTYVLWNHPYAMVILGAETLWVGLALRQGHRNLVLIDAFYWALVGMPLVFLFYGGVQHLGFQVTLATALKQAINGLINALVAGSVVRYLPVEKWLGLDPRPKHYQLGAVVFDISLLLLLVPTVGMIFTLSRREIALGEERMVAQLRTEVRHRAGVLDAWIEHQILALNSVAALGREFRMTPSPQLQEELRDIHRLAPGFRNLYLADAQGRSVGFEPALNVLGKSNVGLDFSDHEYVKALKVRLRPVVSEVFVGRRVLFEPIFTISAPLVEEGRLLGYGSGAVSMEHLQSLLTQAQGADPPYLTLVDIHNNVVTTTDPDLRPLMPWSEPRGARIQPIENGVMLRVPAVRRNISVMETWKGARYFTKTPIRGTEWTLLAELPAGPLQQRAFNLAIWSLVALGGLFLLVLAVSTIVAQALSGATVRLATFSEDLPTRIESGEHLAWPDSRFQEISQLTSHFRTTSLALGERINQLKTETERRVEIERALIHQSRLAAMGEMIGHIAHQWRQPLNSLSMLLANLRERIQQKDLDAESLEQAFAKGDLLIGKMSSTVSDFRNFFSPDKAMTVFSALQQVRAALGLMEASLRAGDVSVTVEAAADVRLFGFPNEYSQVLLNLLANARQAMDESGASTRLITIRLTEAEGYGALSVADSGGGIPADILGRIFEPYFSTRASGTGIGLYMCRQIIEGNMGGRIAVRNVGDGAEFTIRVPLAGEDR